MDRPGGYDPLLTFSTMALVCVGMVMIYSASAFYAVEYCRQDAEYFLKRQAAAAAAGILMMIIIKNLDYRWLRNRVLLYAILISALGSLVVVLLPFFRPVNGAQRWINMGGFNFQPAEWAKLALIIYLAYSLARKQEQIKTFTIGFLPHVLLVGLFGILLLKQPDFGTSAMLFLLLFAMLFVAGAKISYLLLAVIAVTPAAFWLVKREPYRYKRLLAFFNPLENPQTLGYQIRESWMSIGSGRLTGLGLGEGKQKLHFLPAAHTDFIFAIIGEELGFIGMCVVIVLFVSLAIAGMRIARRSRDVFGMFLAFGITWWLMCQTVINMMVVLGVAPTKGFPLPLVSYGGTSLIVTMTAIGLLHSIHSRQGTPPPLGAAEDSTAPAPAVSRRRAFGAEKAAGKVARALTRGRNIRVAKGRKR